MTQAQIEGPAYEPRPVIRIPIRGTYFAAVARRHRLARLGGAPAVTLLVLGLLAAVAHWIPELGLGRLMPDVFALFGTAVARPIFTGGETPFGDAPDAGAAPTVAFVAALALGFATRQGGWFRYAIVPAAAVTAIAAVPIAVAALTDPLANVFSLLAALTCIACSSVAAVVSVRGHLRRGAHPFARRVPGLHGWRNRWLTAYLLVLPVPFMVGRAIVWGQLRDSVAVAADAGSPATFGSLVSVATPLTWAVGAIAGVAVWAAMRFVPPIRELPVVPPAEAFSAGPGLGANAWVAGAIEPVRPHLVAPAIVAVVLVALGAALIAPAAAEAARATLTVTFASVTDAPDASIVAPGAVTAAP